MAATLGLDSRYVIGAEHVIPAVLADADEMVEFARKFDPQAIHLSDAAAREAGFAGLVASGWYVCSLFMRQFVSSIINDSSALVSPGVESIRWLNPLIAGVELSGVAKVSKVLPSFSVPGGSIVTFDVELGSVSEPPVKIATLSMHCLFGRNRKD
ncbi:hypothetical protein FZI91_13700 [Mycobacterium sp. CBMA271]|uniref:MaoC/PaaZ C-terminal domain-containing protein n=1 Tax=unclassified Mycobacteroides TaxID=2618759 RepID=UPI0012DE9D54|nr:MULTISPECIES: MaoC/PaaZ C-terminal domain-containing protein [unclassified Mycobacteroides]MUM18788.1 hypothetical protein [Mycobacteroides sp. CBMA 326]MUM22751.1 hypothetical protein [Mycobacteroides sp. CBMA 271]